MNEFRTLADLLCAPTRGRRVFVRADLNVPLDEGRIRDDLRIRATLPTLERLLADGARVVVASHLGRPNGRCVPALSLAPIADRLEAQLGHPVQFEPSLDPDRLAARVAALADGELLLLENLRFEPGETANDPAFVDRLARLADVYVLDAFASAHRAHASTLGLQERFDARAVGELVEWELRHLEPLLEPDAPFVCLVGGAKVANKAPLLEALAQRADTLAIGGAMAFPFLSAKGQSVGASLFEPEATGLACRVLAAAARSGCRLLLPRDHRVCSSDGTILVSKEIAAGAAALDIGPETAAAFTRALEAAKTVFWNGPMGVFEQKGFGEGTRTVAEAVAKSGAYTVVGGGETVAALREFGLEEGPRHVSTGGGAALEYVAGHELPALAALRI